MKHCILFLHCFLLTYSLAAVAEQPKPMSGMGMGMMGMMMSMSDEQLEARMKSMQVHMLMMHDLSNQILAESDPNKKQDLKNQQIELMKAHHKKMMAMHAQKTSQHHEMKKE